MGVTLREIRDADIPVFFEHQIDPVAHRMAGFKPRDRNAFMEHWAKIHADPTVVSRSILYDGRLAGFVVVFSRDETREIGYWIDRKFWGKGITTEALLQFLAAVDERPLVAVIAGHNVASIRVAEKCGFVLARETETDRTYRLE